MRLQSIGILTVGLAVLLSLARPNGCLAEDKTGPRLEKRPPAPHPLDPLRKDEVTTAVAVLKAADKVAETSRFVLIHLHEPPKEAVLAYQPGKALPRQAFVVLYDWATNATSEAIVDLAEKKLLSWKNIPGAQPPLLPEDDHRRTGEIVRADAGWQQAMKKRGIKDLDKVFILGYPIGAYAPEVSDGSRLVFALMFSREYGSLDDLLVLVNLTKKKVFKLEDRALKLRARKPRVFPEFEGRGEAGTPTPPRGDPLKDARFHIEGNEVSWHHWRFRFGMHPRVGLVLYTVGYEEQGKVRPVLYRASLSEMVVPYGDPYWQLWSPFDAGEFGLGVFAKSPLNPGKDAPADAVFFNAVLHNRKGSPVEVPRAVALYERDGGVLWRSGNSGQWARQLVLSSFAKVENYDYGFNWVFHQDGTLEMEVLLIGAMLTKRVDREEDDEGHEGQAAFGHLVAPHIEAPNHQHFFNFRLDLDIEGPGRNSVLELNTEALPEGPRNPYGNGFVMRETPLRRELEVQRPVNLATGRKWKVINTCVKNSLGQPTGYVLVPGENSVPYATAKSFVRRNAGFVNAHLWVTPYRPEEMYAAGDYVNGGKPGGGLPKWTGANRPIEDQDIVVWYTLGVTHVPRPEEWPIMPVHRAGFKLVPAGFFSRNPALPAPKAKSSP